VSGRNRIFWSQEGGSYITPVRMRPVWYSSLFARNTRCTLDVHWLYRMYTGCTLDVHWMYTGCTLDVHWRLGSCRATVDRWQ